MTLSLTTQTCCLGFTCKRLHLIKRNNLESTPVHSNDYLASTYSLETRSGGSIFTKKKEPE